MAIRLSSLATAILLAWSLPARADFLTFQFDHYVNGSNSVVTNPGNATYTASPSSSTVAFVPTTGSLAPQIIASGFSGLESASGTFGSLTAKDLYFKNGGADEDGLGMATSPDKEISFLGTNPSDIVRFNLTSLFPPFTDASITIQSVQTPEGFQLFKSSSATDPGSPFLTRTGGDTDVASFKLDASTPYLWISATPHAGADVLVNNLQVSTAVPEPSSLALFAVGFGGLAGYLRFARRRTRA